MLIEKIPFEIEVDPRKLRGACGVYCFRNRKTHKRYIGATQDMHLRCAAHSSFMRGGRVTGDFLRAAQRGEKFVFTVLEFCEADDRKMREAAYIQVLQTDSPQFGYNRYANRARRRCVEFRVRYETAVDEIRLRLLQSNSPFFQRNVRAFVAQFWKEFYEGASIAQLCQKYKLTQDEAEDALRSHTLPMKPRLENAKPVAAK